jgi:hypothetical protein
MPLSFSPLTDLPDPPTKTSPIDFAAKADVFLDSLPGFQSEMNGVIAGLNAITSGLDQQTPIAAWAAGTSYSFPTVVAGSDGYSYRCIGTNVVGVNPTTNNGSSWVNVGSGSSIIGSVVVSENANATPRYLHILTASCTLTLPASPQINTPISVVNLSGTLTAVINPGAGIKINGIAESMTVDILNVTINLLYTGATYGWVVL